MAEQTVVEPLEGAEAFGAPGVPPRWAPGNKLAVGKAAAAASPVWFTVAEGVLTEVYYPRVDLANTRDLQLLIAGPEGAFWEERRDTEASVELLDPHALAWRVTTRERSGRFTTRKRLCTDPGRPTVLSRVRFEAGAPDLRLFALLAPHIGGRGAGNSARLVRAGGQTLLVASRHDTYAALGASCPLPAASCGFVGASDGWTDVRGHGELTWRFSRCSGGNVALAAELAPGREEFTLALGFGHSEAEACGNALASLEPPYEQVEAAYIAGWREWCARLEDLSGQAADGGRLYYTSAMVLKAHEDIENPGAHIASLAVPWGAASGDANAGGYHLVWPRDLYHTATGRLAAGDVAGARAALRYLERTQRGDGTWPQNFWVFGEPYWRGLQLDELAFPILLAWQLQRAGGLEHNPYPGLVRDAAYAVARIGPVTPQERWEENSGYSPSTLAAGIAALVCAAEFARDDRDPAAEAYFLDVADYWQTKLEDWTFTTQGCHLPGLTEHYERIAPLLAEEADLDARAGNVFLPIANLPPGVAMQDTCTVIDGGFLELVRYGVRAPGDDHVARTVRAYDLTCRVQLPQGPCWHRYTHDGYGQKDDGEAFDGTGCGRPWPLLTGERAHYELAAGGDAGALAAVLERLANQGGMIPEQVWDGPPLPAKGLLPGGPTGSAAPLCWAHAEYVKLLRSLRDGHVFDRPEPVHQRYVADGVRSDLVIWKFNHKVRGVPAGGRARVEVYAPAALHWSADGWRHVVHEPCVPRGHGVWTYDFPREALGPGGQVAFTFYWPEAGRWEGQNFMLSME